MQELIAQHSELDAVSFGFSPEAALTAKAIESTDGGSRFTVTGAVEGEFTIPVYGAHQVKNALAAILIAKELGLSQEGIQASLQDSELTAMRMQPIVVGNGALIINDAYNAAPTSMRAALRFMDETDLREEKWLVLGDMLELGTEEQQYHEELADDIESLELNGVLLYGPRMKWLHDELQRRGFSRKLHWSEQSYEPLIAELAEGTGEHSIILLKGSRGMALENILEGWSKGQ